MAIYFVQQLLHTVHIDISLEFVQSHYLLDVYDLVLELRYLFVYV